MQEGDMLPGVLDRDSISELLRGSPPLVEGYSRLSQQLQPHGFDLTLKTVSIYSTPGYLGRLQHQRVVSSLKEMSGDEDGILHLVPGPYLVTFNEVVNLPNHIMALGLPRSTLLRSGVAVHTAVWDAGYSGRSEAMLAVYNPQGFRLELGARIVQLVFLPLNRPVTEGYQGAYQGENLDKPAE
jgi:dUTP pyrophosphatase